MAKRITPQRVSDYLEQAVKDEAAAALAARGPKTVTIKDKRIFGIAFLGDIHYGAPLTDYAALEAHIKLILDTPGLYVILGGDCIDNHIKWVSAMLAAKMTIKSQHRWLFHTVSQFHRAKKLLAIVNGNHEAWTKTMAGLDPLEMYVKDFTDIGRVVPYSPYELELNLVCNKVTYLVALRHKYRFNSSQNASHSNKRFWEYGPGPWDVGALFDKHEFTVEPFSRHRKIRWAVRPGAYQIASDFSMAHGYPDAHPVSPAVLFNPDKRDLQGVMGLEWAGAFLRKVR